MGALIEILKIIETKEGGAKITIAYNNDLKETVKNYFGVKTATKNRIKTFLYQAIMEGILRHKRKGLARDEKE